MSKEILAKDLMAAKEKHFKDELDQYSKNLYANINLGDETLDGYVDLLLRAKKNPTGIGTAASHYGMDYEYGMVKDLKRAGYVEPLERTGFRKYKLTPKAEELVESLNTQS